jgi:hypothetical protein
LEAHLQASGVHGPTQGLFLLLMLLFGTTRTYFIFIFQTRENLARIHSALEAGQLPISQACSETVLTEMLPWVPRLARTHGPASILLNQLCSFSPHGFRGRISCAPDTGLAEIDDENDTDVVEASTATTAAGTPSAASSAKPAPSRDTLQHKADDIEDFDDE